MRGWLLFQRVIIIIFALALTGCGDADKGATLTSAAPIVSANNEFSWNLYKQVRRTNENLICSPFSLSYSTGLLYTGARGQTATEIAQAMRYPSNSVATSLHALANCLRRANTENGVELDLANAIWASSAIQFLPDFVQTAKRQFECALHNVDFTTRSETARQEINSWITEKMKGKLQGNIPAGVLDSNSRLVLVNAIYFHGTWKTKFDESATRHQPFYVSDDVTVNVPMMSCSGTFRHHRSRGCEVLELPYKSGTASMFIVLPERGRNLDNLESALGFTGLSGLLKTVAFVEATELEVHLPRFYLKSDLPLNKPLQGLGIHDAFTGTADFSGIDSAKEAYLSSVEQQAFIEVDEEGTKAGAASVHMVTSLGMHSGFIADHPFLFVITENSTGAIMFIGRVTDPTKQ